jgi:hypothetical protein
MRYSNIVCLFRLEPNTCGSANDNPEAKIERVKIRIAFLPCSSIASPSPHAFPIFCTSYLVVLCESDCEYNLRDQIKGSDTPRCLLAVPTTSHNLLWTI